MTPVFDHRAGPVSRLLKWLEGWERPRLILVGGGALAVIVAACAIAAVASTTHPGIVRFWSAATAISALMLITFIGGLGAALTSNAGRYALLRQVTNALPRAEFVIDAQGKLLSANASAGPILRGHQRPLDLLGGALEADDETAAEELDRLTMLARMGGAGRGDIRLRLDPDAAPVTFTVEVAPLAQPKGSALWSLEDVTAERELNYVVRTERAGLDDFLDAVPIGLFALDEQGRFVWVNQTVADWLGMSAAALVVQERRLVEFLTPAGGRHKPFDPLAPCDGTRLSLRGAGGGSVETILSQSVVMLGNGALRTRSALRRLEHDSSQPEVPELTTHRFQRFFDIAPIGIALADPEGRFIETNRSLDALLAAPGEPVFRRALSDFVVEQDWKAISERLAAIAAGETLSRPLEIRLNPPRDRTVALFVSRLSEEDGARSGYILHFIDLTEQKNLEAQFAQSQKMQAVGQLAGGVAHDFNNLLTAMIGFCDLLLLRFRPGDQSFADIMQVKQNANRAASLVRQLLAFSRQQTLQPRVIDIGEVLSELSHLLNRLLGENIELRLAHGRDLGPVKVDPGQLEQVIINLAVNARDAMPKGGILQIRTENIDLAKAVGEGAEVIPSGSYIRIEVTDTGAGIPPDIIGRIFEPFFSTKDVGSGTGLGLSTVYGIVKQTGGFIVVNSTLGTGTRFHIYLPRHQGEVTAPAAPVEEPPQGDLTGVGTILLVEDEAPVRMFTARALRNKGYTVLEARSGDMALELIAETPGTIDLVITDVMMPRMDGPTLVDHIRAKLPTIKVIFISGYAEDTFGERLSGEKGLHFLPKPYSLKDLAAAVKEIITSPST